MQTDSGASLKAEEMVEMSDDTPIENVNPRYFDYKVNESAPRLNLKLLPFEKLPFAHPLRFGFLNNWVIDNSDYAAPLKFDNLMFTCFDLFKT